MSIVTGSAAAGSRLDISRPAVTAALRHLDLAQLVKKQRNGVYQLNTMLAGHLSPADCTAAIAGMDPDERLNATDFVERHHEAVRMYQEPAKPGDDCAVSHR
ncbi:hypothetical protein [Streptomyces sp. NPDC048489]|uniref:hypothetical protein n=1 Tax=Streptomyces sp. NPDC048489 TaxID=3154504 RepID=UPI0034407471